MSAPVQSPPTQPPRLARSRAVTRRQFAAADLAALLDSDVHAVRINDFLNPAALSHLRTAFIGRSDHGPLATDGQFRRIGHAFSETQTPADREQYFASAPAHLETLRAIAAPYPYPADQVRLLLDEIWPTGTRLLRNGTRPFFAGVARYQLGGIDLEPHTDNIGRNLPDQLDIAVTRQLSVNVYLDVPEQGGELEIWDQYPDEREYLNRSGERVYGLDRSSVGTATSVIKPVAGEAIFIDPRRVHAVAPSSDRPRITIGLFIGLVDAASPLVVWS